MSWLSRGWRAGWVRRRTSPGSFEGSSGWRSCWGCERTCNQFRLEVQKWPIRHKSWLEKQICSMVPILLTNQVIRSQFPKCQFSLLSASIKRGSIFHSLSAAKLEASERRASNASVRQQQSITPRALTLGPYSARLRLNVLQPVSTTVVGGGFFSNCCHLVKKCVTTWD